MAETGFLLVGHGTRERAGQEQCKQLFEQFDRLMAPAKCGFAFLELASPNIDEAMLELANRGVRNVMIVPVLLFSAGHAESDIPNEVERAAQSHGLSVLSYTEPFASHPAIIALSATRFEQALQAVSPQPNQPPHNSQPGGEITRRDVALAMIGRGSNSSSATQAMRDFVAKRCQQTPVAWQETGFIHAQHPNLKTALDSLAGTDFPIKVVQPHLLFEGRLSQDIRALVLEYGRADPASHWVVADVLGADELLSQALVQMAKLAVPEDMRA